MPEISEEDLKSLNDAKTQLTNITKTLDGLKGEVDTLKVAKTDLERKLDDADKELLSESYLDFKGKKDKGGGPSPEKGGGDFDYESASAREVAHHIAGLSKVETDKAIKEVTAKIEQTEHSINKMGAQVDVALCALRHSDFDTNQEAIFKVAKANPSWGAEKCYNQWTMVNKATADAKVAEDTKKAEDDRRALTEKGEGVAESATQDKEVTEDQALDAAYDKSFGSEKQ